MNIKRSKIPRSLLTGSARSRPNPKTDGSTYIFIIHYFCYPFHIASMLKRDNITLFIENCFATTFSRDNFTLVTDFFENIANFRNLNDAMRRLQSITNQPRTDPPLFTDFNAANMRKILKLQQYRRPYTQLYNRRCNAALLLHHTHFCSRDQQIFTEYFFLCREIMTKNVTFWHYKDNHRYSR